MLWPGADKLTLYVFHGISNYVAESNTKLGHKILDIAAAQIEAMIEPEREACPWGTTC
jgi:hypothetical protein